MNKTTVSALVLLGGGAVVLYLLSQQKTQKPSSTTVTTTQTPPSLAAIGGAVAGNIIQRGIDYIVKQPSNSSAPVSASNAPTVYGIGDYSEPSPS